jgi:hypothetical protein
LKDRVVVNNTPGGRYEIETEAGPAVLEYLREGKRLTLVHTGVPKAVASQGLGTLLVKTALEDARAQGLKVVPLCGFARTFIARHPEYSALVTTP